MKYDNLTRAQRQVVNRAVRRSHRRRIEVRVYTLDDEFVQSLAPRFLGGEVTGDDSSSPSRVATFDVLEPTRGLVFEPDEPGEESVHRKFKIELVDMRQIRELDGEWVEQTLIYGPVWDFSREGAVAHLQVDGTDRLAMGSVRRARAWLRKTKMTDVITGLLREAGSRDNRIPDLPKTTPVHVHVGTVKVKVHDDGTASGGKHHDHVKTKTKKVRHLRGFTTHHTDTYLGKAHHLAQALDRHLYPDAEGTFRLRRPPERPVYRFDGATLLSDPVVEHPTNEGPNTFIVIGAKPKGSRRRVSSGKVGFAANHPLSASELAWHDQPYEVIEQKSNPHLKTKVACQRVAKHDRDEAERMLVNVTIEALPIPWVVAQERFKVATTTRWGVPSVTVHQWTYPLSSDPSPMTLGAVRRAVPKRPTIRGRELTT